MNKEEVEKEDKKPEDKKDKGSKIKSELKDKEKKVKELEDRIKQLEKQNLEQKVTIDTINADYVNKVKVKATEAQEKLNEKINEYKSSFEEKLKEAKKYAIEKSALELIQAIDTFKMAISNEVANPEVNAYVQGFRMIYSMLENSLKSAGINVIATKVGDEFDPIIHNAMETEGEGSNKITKVIKDGYKLHDRIIQPVMVKIGK